MRSRLPILLQATGPNIGRALCFYLLVYFPCQQYYTYRPRLSTDAPFAICFRYSRDIARTSYSPSRKAAVNFLKRLKLPLSDTSRLGYCPPRGSLTGVPAGCKAAGCRAGDREVYFASFFLRLEVTYGARQDFVGHTSSHSGSNGLAL